MPNEITGLSAFEYSELLILEQGKKQMNLDEKIPRLKRIALYCIDEIKQKNIEVAKKLGLDIILVKSKKYFENKEYYKEKFKYIEKMDYNYFNGYSEREKFESKR